VNEEALAHWGAVAPNEKMYLIKNKNHEALHYENFTFSLYFLPFRPKYLPKPNIYRSARRFDLLLSFPNIYNFPHFWKTHYLRHISIFPNIYRGADKSLARTD